MPPNDITRGSLLDQGKRLQSGDGITPGNVQAFELFLESANAGDPDAQYLVGECYLNGRGVEKSEPSALDWLRKAAHANSVKAFLRLGMFHERKNDEEAVRWYSKAVDAGHRGACALISSIYKAHGMPAEALEWEKRAALMGGQDSLWTVRVYYENAREKGLDLAEAHAWLSLFEDGFTRERDSIYLAAYMLHPNLESFKTTAAQLAEAMGGEELADARRRYAELVAKRMEHVKGGTAAGSGEWQYMLGWSFFYGYGLQDDASEAVKWWSLSADQGHNTAANNLGYCYKYGRGVEQDHQEAVRWFRRAAEKGNSAAQYSLGHSYCAGLGVPQDREEGGGWIRKAAEAGNTVAQRNMGFLYENGWGVPQDRAQALAWYRFDAQRNPEAGKDAEALSASMSSDELERAEALFRELLARHRN